MSKTYKALLGLGAVVALASAAGCAARRGAAPSPATHKSPRTASSAAALPKVVVLVVVDQLPSWSFAAKANSGLFTRGFARLTRQGRYYPEVRYPYAATLTASGHAALVTGAPPATSGIAGNEWFHRGEGRLVNCVEDQDRPLWKTAPAATQVGRGASPHALRAETVGDALRRRHPDAKVVTVSLKDRAAILTGGKRPTLALWYDAEQPSFTSSRYYAPAPPPWLLAHQRKHPIAAHLDYVWRPLDAELLARVAGVDGAPGEQTDYPLGAVFPHRLADTGAPASKLKETPKADELLLQVALAAFDAEGLGNDATPDLFVISFSSPDYVGHRWGQESWEMHDELLRLDRRLGELLDALDQRLGRGRYALLLTSDHGATRMVERSRAAGKVHARRVNPDHVHRVAEAAAAKLLGRGDWIVDEVRTPTIYLTAAARKLPAARRRALVVAASRAVQALPGVAYARPSAALVGRCESRSEPEATYCRALVPGLSGEVFYFAAPDCMVHGSQRKPVTHGSPNPDDSTVPLFLYAPGRIAAGMERAAVTTLQVAPTLAKLLGVPAPKQARGSALPVDRPQ